ncbi:hypothetical protein E2C01_035796 [Portunus trituberculatus]|uniref:Uncharacterized protein n=1 Tax=Portunus trituberculatus TaxID=210409 RepID=A0A5B7F6V9_PORTR|nr:hypothetical protein [Portunus trituberculatus]
MFCNPSCVAWLFGSMKSPSSLNTDLKLSFISSLIFSVVSCILFPLINLMMVSLSAVFSFIYLKKAWVPFHISSLHLFFKISLLLLCVCVFT